MPRTPSPPFIAATRVNAPIYNFAHSQKENLEGKGRKLALIGSHPGLYHFPTAKLILIHILSLFSSLCNCFKLVIGLFLSEKIKIKLLLTKIIQHFKTKWSKKIQARKESLTPSAMRKCIPFLSVFSMTKLRNALMFSGRVMSPSPSTPPSPEVRKGQALNE